MIDEIFAEVHTTVQGCDATMVQPTFFSLVHKKLLQVLFFHFIYNVFAGAQRQSENGPGNIFICL